MGSEMCIRDSSDPAHHGASVDHVMDHDTPLEVDAGSVPTLEIALTADPMSGYNLHVMAQNFQFSPEQASLEHVSGQGHAHVYVNGAKHSRLYGPWLHLASLPKGLATVEVTLNSNNHRPFMVNGKPIAARTTLEVN